MKSSEKVISIGSRVILVVPSNQHMNEFIEKSKVSKNLHASWTQAPSDEKEYLAYLARSNYSETHAYARFLGLYSAITLMLYGHDIKDPQLVQEAKESLLRINSKLLEKNSFEEFNSINAQSDHLLLAKKCKGAD